MYEGVRIEGTLGQILIGFGIRELGDWQNLQAESEDCKQGLKYKKHRLQKRRRVKL